MHATHPSRREVLLGFSALVAPAFLAPALTTGSAAAQSHDGHESDDAPRATGPEAALYLDMRTVWIQHMHWTYSTIVAFASDFPGLQATLDRLLLNQADIGHAVVPYYGDVAGAQLTDLLKAHINDAVPVLGAAKAGDNAALKTAVDAWYANARDIADFLAGANPNWPQADMREMMEEHITQTVAYATAILTGDYAGAVATYGEAEAHMIAMGDMLSAGLVAQFPDRFA